MSRFLRTCNSPGCSELVRYGYCPTHHKANEARREKLNDYPRHTEVYDSTRWRVLRLQVKRAQPLCAVRGCHHRTTDIDHIVGITEGGAPYDLANLQGLCRRHHASKTAREVGERRSRRRDGASASQLWAF